VGDGGPVLLVAAGSGIAPLMSMVRHRAAQGSTVPMLLLASARTRQDVIFRGELTALGAAGTGFQFVTTLTRESGGGGAFSRRVDAAMMADVLGRLPEAPKVAFICGSNAFVDAAAESLIAAGVAPASIRTERYGV
jgi:ferredoxin-NADP reductase